jgi:hypothetical protein
MLPVPLALVLISGCASSAPSWAFQSGAVTPSASGLTGVQAWSFFTSAWGRAKSDQAFVCARSQEVSGTTAAPLPGCIGCTAAYTLTVSEIDSDCDADLADDPSYTLPVAIAIGPVDDALADLDPHPGRSLGWYASFDGVQLESYGFAWDIALDEGGDAGPPGWNPGQTYTLGPSFAWDLTAAPSGG